MTKLKKLINTRTGRAFIRFVKTFLYTCVSFYIVNKTGTFVIDYLAMVEIGLLAGLGFGGDKYIRTK